jgi:IS4 transposase
VLTGLYTRQGFDRPLRRVKFNDAETGKTLVFLANHFVLPATTIAKLYKYRWQVELFFPLALYRLIDVRPCTRHGFILD